MKWGFSLCQRYAQIQSKLNEIPETTDHLVELTEFVMVTNDKTVYALLDEVQVSTKPHSLLTNLQAKFCLFYKNDKNAQLKIF